MGAAAQTEFFAGLVTEMKGSSVPMGPGVVNFSVREPIVTGLRLGLGVAIIGTLLAETKLSNRGLGFLIINAYSTFNMPRMYALLIVLFVLSIGVNALIGRFGGVDAIRR